MENLTEQDIIQIEAFLAESLPVDQRQQLAQDEAFGEKVSLYQLAREAIDAAGDAHLKAQLKEMYQPEARVRSLRPVYMALAIAAVITLLLIVFWPRPKPTPQELFAANYEKPLLGSGQRGEADQIWIQALSDYQTGTYEQAVTGFEQVLNDTSFQEKDLARVYLAISYLEMEEIDPAENILSAVKAGSDYERDAQWYLALAYLKTGKLDMAKPLLVSLSQNSRTYGERADEMLSYINSP